MIFTILNGLSDFRKTPITWTLFFLNLAVFIWSIVPGLQAQLVLDRYLDNDHFLQVQGRAYSEYLLMESPSSLTPLMRRMAESSKWGDEEKQRLMGSLALRDQNFLQVAIQMQVGGDLVEVKQWKRGLAHVLEAQKVHPSYVLGLTGLEAGLDQWVTYIFAHSSFSHFFWNMYFLFIFGSMVEPIIGSLALLIGFVLSGMVAGGLHLFIAGASATPLVGASGAVSGLMALFSFYYWKKPVRFFYVFGFLPQHMGTVYLPAWIVLLTFFITDLAGYWGALNEFGGVSHVAHLGGMGSACVVALVVLALGKKKAHLSYDSSIVMGQFVSVAEHLKSIQIQNVQIENSKRKTW